MKFNIIKTILYCLCMFTLIVLISMNVAADDETMIRIDPSSQIISPGESFSFDIVCTPTVPVKSFELKFSFDPSLVHITEISEGNLFEGYQNFPNLGTIDNYTGNVRDVFDLILGYGNVSDEGTCISVSGVALTNAGNASIHLYDVGVTDETGYLPIEISDGFVDIQHNIVLSDPSPSDAAENVKKSKESLSVSITHKKGGLFNYSIITSPMIGSTTQHNQGNGTKICEISGLSYDTTYEWTVSVQECDTGNWTNKTFQFNTESKPVNNGGDSPSDGGFPAPPPVDEQENTPPETPIKPSGPLYIEPGVSYVFETTSFDLDDDQIRYRFDWGDGNKSAWSDFVSSNQSVSMVYQWEMISNFTVKVICQDEPGENSSWSEGLTVICKALDNEDLGTPPVANFTISDNIAFNETMMFNASISSDLDGDIVSYTWDFGDGSTATGMNPVHRYDQPGVYEITLVVTDSKGNSFSKTMIITIPAQGDSNTTDTIGGSGSIFPWVFIIFGLVGALIVGWMIIKRKEYFFPWLHRRQQQPSERHLFDNLSISETFLDSIQRIKELSEGLLRPIYGSNQRPIGFQQKKNDDQSNQVMPLQPTGQIKEDSDVFAEPIHDESSDRVEKFFGKYSHDEVRKHLNRIFKERSDDEDENK